MLRRGSLLALALIAGAFSAAVETARAVVPGVNDQIAFSRIDGALEIYTMNPDGNAEEVRTDTGFNVQPSWSPDGTMIAFTSFRDGNSEIYTMNADGTEQVRRTTNPASDGFPAWSPDGTKIAFASNRDGGLDEIYTINADGSAPMRLTTNTAADTHPAWSPDGTMIAFTSLRDGDFVNGNFNIYTMNANGTGQVGRTTNASADSFPTWSPDGAKIAFMSDRDGNGEIYTMNADGSGQVNRTADPAGDASPAWSPDGTQIAFSRAGEIYTMNADGTAQVQRTTNAVADQDPDWGTNQADSDRDALPDSWEEDGLDVDGDGTADLDLPAMGAEPDHKDVFVEIDFMTGHRIDQSEIDKVIEAFKNAPVTNPDTQPGIALHVDNGPSSVMDPVSGATWGTLSDQDTLTHQDVLGSNFAVGSETRYDWSQFEATRQTKFLSVRRTAFRYAIAAHSGPSQGWAGLARGGAADFIIAMHENCEFNQPLETECTQEADYTGSTFMHELGHVLGLDHGGTDELPRKPNYLSVMNYSFGWGLRVDGGFKLDYSRFELPLDENALDEEIGFGITTGPLTTFETIFRCAGGGPKYRISLTTENTDWNCDQSITGIGLVSADVSDDAMTTTLSGPTDWDKLAFSRGGIGAAAAPPGPDSTVIDEPTPTELRENRDVLENGTAPPFNPPTVPPAAGGGSSALPAPPPQLRKKCKKGFKRVKGKCRKKKRKN
jgi:hypothetical protein